MKAECPRCKKVVASYIPSKGDGTVRWFFTHLCAAGEWARMIEVPGFGVGGEA